MNYDELTDTLNRFMPTFGDLFRDLCEQLMAGELPGLDRIREMCISTVKENVADMMYVMISLLMIGLLSAVLHQFGNVFGNRQIADLAFYFTYLYGVILLLQVFYVMAETAVLVVENIISFTQILIPAFYIAVAMCYASITAGAFYQLNLLLLYAVEIIFPEVVIPLVTCFVFVSVISGSTEDDRFAELISLIKKGVALLIKFCITTVTGVGVMKSLIHPVADSVSFTMVQKTVAAIPGIGDITDSVSKMFLGSAVLIKNSVGMAGLIVLSVLFLIPVCKLILLILMYMVSQAIVQPVADKRMLACIHSAAEGMTLLLKIEGTVFVLLFLSMAIMSAASGSVFGGW